MKGNLDAVKKSVDANPDLPNFKREDGASILSIAAANGRDEIVKHLLLKGANVDAQDKYGTSLHRAAEGQHLEVTKILLDHGANPNSQDDWGQTPLHYANDNTNGRITQLLLKAGAKPTITDKNGLTPLHRCKNVEVAKALIKAGAKINSVDKKGFNALHWAASPREIVNRPTIEFLLKNGIEVDKENLDGKTPLQMAIENEQDELVLILKNWHEKVRPKKEEK